MNDPKGLDAHEVRELERLGKIDAKKVDRKERKVREEGTGEEAAEGADKGWLCLCILSSP